MSTEPKKPGREPWFIRRLRKRADRQFKGASAASRISAYVYGNVPVLAAIVAANPSAARTGEAFVYIVGTALTAFLAHILVHTFSASALHGKVSGQETRQELRDASPILTAGFTPAVMVGVGALAQLDGRISLGAAAALILARLAFIGPVVERLRRKTGSAAALWGGIALVLGASIIVVVRRLIAP